MLALIVDLLGAFLSAKYLRKLWLAIPTVITISILGTIGANMLIYYTNMDLFTPGEILAKIIVGSLWHPVISIIAFFIFRKKVIKQNA